MAVGFLLSLACAAACRDNGPVSTATLPVLGASAQNTSVANDAPSLLSGGQILEVTHAANAGEIEQAKLAQTKSSDTRVNKLATMMIADHTNADTAGAELARMEGLTLLDSTTSSGIKTDGGQILADLTAKSGAAFDKAYVDAQVKEHTAVLGIVDNQLIPNAKDAQVRALIQTIRSKIAEHLVHAQNVQSELSQ
jgi:putative membrane protein